MCVPLPLRSDRGVFFTKYFLKDSCKNRFKTSSKALLQNLNPHAAVTKSK